MSAGFRPGDSGHLMDLKVTQRPAEATAPAATNEHDHRQVVGHRRPSPHAPSPDECAGCLNEGARADTDTKWANVLSNLVSTAPTASPRNDPVSRMPDEKGGG